MFLKNSRYFGIPTVTAVDRDGQQVCAVKLRPLPQTSGSDYMVKGGDQLDVIAKARYADASLYWHIGDANSELEAQNLLSPDGGVIKLPGS